MKKMISIFLLFTLVFVLCGCSNNHADIAFPVKFYYRTVPVSYGTDASIITAEVRDATEFHGNYTELIELYLNGPKQYSCISPIPAGTTLEEITLSGNKMQILLSPHMAVLSGSELMVACACLSRTIIELTGVSTVQIRAENSLLNNQEFITVTSESFVYLDTE